MADSDPETKLKRTGDELEERLGRLDDHIGEARSGADAAREGTEGLPASGDLSDEAPPEPIGDEPVPDAEKGRGEHVQPSGEGRDGEGE